MSYTSPSIGLEIENARTSIYKFLFKRKRPGQSSSVVEHLTYEPSGPGLIPNQDTRPGCVFDRQ